MEKHRQLIVIITVAFEQRVKLEGVGNQVIASIVIVITVAFVIEVKLSFAS